MLGALVHCIAATREEESALERKWFVRSTRRYALRALPDRIPAHRRGAHGPVQLAVRPPPRRQVPAADRGYRQGPLDQGSDRRDPRRDELARARLGRPRILPVAI